MRMQVRQGSDWGVGGAGQETGGAGRADEGRVLGRGCCHQDHGEGAGKTHTGPRHLEFGGTSSRHSDLGVWSLRWSVCVRWGRGESRRRASPEELCHLSGCASVSSCYVTATCSDSVLGGRKLSAGWQADLSWACAREDSMTRGPPVPGPLPHSHSSTWTAGPAGRVLMAALPEAREGAWRPVRPPRGEVHSRAHHVAQGPEVGGPLHPCEGRGRRVGAEGTKKRACHSGHPSEPPR